MAIRLLATGDIHIGRRPTRVPEQELCERASAARMWGAIASQAIAQRVDAVLLSGDIVDHNNRYYEATGPLERGILQLAEAGIPTFAVAGNHDWDVFPRILKQIDTPLFHFVGAGGKWEEVVLERDGEQLLRIVGWSFPTLHVRQSPLSDLPPLSSSRIPTIGLLHADVDVVESSYVPVRLSELQSANLAAWVLGHIHKPQLWESEGRPTVLYPGTPQALSPAEAGPHGPWLIEINDSRSISCRQLPLSLVRYEQRDVDATGTEFEEDFESLINDTVAEALEQIASNDGQHVESLELLILRLKLTGATPLCGRMDKLLQPLGELERHRGNLRARIDHCANLTRPAVDLDELSRANDPAGALARVLLALESEEHDPSVSSLIRDAMSRVRDVYRAPAYAALQPQDSQLDEEVVGRLLLQQGRRLLEALRSQLSEVEEELA